MAEKKERFSPLRPLSQRMAFCEILLVKRDRMLEAARSVRAGRMGQRDEGKQGLSASTLSNRLGLVLLMLCVAKRYYLNECIQDSSHIRPIPLHNPPTGRQADTPHYASTIVETIDAPRAACLSGSGCDRAKI